VRRLIWFWAYNDSSSRSQPMRNYPASLPIAGPSPVLPGSVNNSCFCDKKRPPIGWQAHDSPHPYRTCQKGLPRFGPVANYSDSLTRILDREGTQSGRSYVTTTRTFLLSIRERLCDKLVTIATIELGQLAAATAHAILQIVSTPMRRWTCQSCKSVVQVDPVSTGRA